MSNNAQMNPDIVSVSKEWPLSELSAMVIDGDLFPFESLFVTWSFLETEQSRLEVLRLIYRQRANPVGATADWVKLGGRLPKEVELQEPRRKNYC